MAVRDRERRGGFGGAPRHPGQKKVGDVRASGQQEEPGSRENQEEPEPHLRRIDLANRHQAHGQFVFERRDGGSDRTDQHSLQLLPAALGALALSKANQDPVAPILAPKFLITGRDGLPNIDSRRKGQRGVEQRASRDQQRFWSDADHNVRDGIQHDGLANDGRIGAVPPAPERIADHHDVLFAGRFFLAGEAAAKLRRGAQKRKEVRRDEGAAEAFGIAIAGEIPLRRRQRGDGFEGGVCLAPPEVVLDAHGHSWRARRSASARLRPPSM